MQEQIIQIIPVSQNRNPVQLEKIRRDDQRFGGGQLAVNQDIYVRAAFYRTKAIYWPINTHRTQLVYDSPSGRSGTGCRPIVIMGLVKARRKKCKAFRLWPFKRMPRTPAQGCEIDDTCLVKMMWMRNKYCITENELCSLVEWFII